MAPCDAGLKDDFSHQLCLSTLTARYLRGVAPTEVGDTKQTLIPTWVGDGSLIRGSVTKAARSPASVAGAIRWVTPQQTNIAGLGGLGELAENKSFPPSVIVALLILGGIVAAVALKKSKS